jgi:hypothetical protein
MDKVVTSKLEVKMDQYTTKNQKQKGGRLYLGCVEFKETIICIF